MPEISSVHDRPKLTRAEAARLNGARSRGPVTEAGKRRSAMNALKHGLTADRFTLAPGEDGKAYDELESRLAARFAPSDEVAAHLVQRLASVMWRQYRGDRIEAEVLAQRERRHDPNYIDGYVPSSPMVWDAGRFNAVQRYQGRLDRMLFRLLDALERHEPLPEPAAADAPPAAPIAPELAATTAAAAAGGATPNEPESPPPASGEVQNEPDEQPAAPAVSSPDASRGDGAHEARSPARLSLDEDRELRRRVAAELAAAASTGLPGEGSQMRDEPETPPAAPGSQAPAAPPSSVAASVLRARAAALLPQPGRPAAPKPSPLHFRLELERLLTTGDWDGFERFVANGHMARLGLSPSHGPDGRAPAPRAAQGAAGPVSPPDSRKNG
jgi:hypothetical protein